MNQNSTHDKIFLIANPVAGHHSLRNLWDQEIQIYLKQHFKNFDYEFTAHKGHATQLARAALKNGFSKIIAMGGDGTINECVNGFFDSGTNLFPEASLGILPFGSGGDFIRTLKFERDYQKVVQRLQTGVIKKIDIGMVRFEDRKQRYFINIAQVGLGSAIMTKVNAKKKKIPALIRYVTGSIQGFFDYKNIPVRLKLDQQKPMEINLTNLIVANGQYFGRGMRPAPFAKLDDGLFDVVVIKDMNLFRFMYGFPQMYFVKKNVSNKILQTYQTQEISIEVVDYQNKLGTEVDGENCGFGNQTLSVLPQSLNLWGFPSPLAGEGQGEGLC